MSAISCKPLLVAVFVLALPLEAHAGCADSDGRAAAQRGLGAWKSWCSACGGTPVEGPRCQPGANWGGRGAGGGMTGDPFVDLGITLGQELRKGLFGDPEAEARRRAEREAAEQAAREEQARRAAEERRLNDERYRRLMGLLGGGELALKGVERNEQLRLKTSTPVFGIRSNPEPQSIGLSDLKLGGWHESPASLAESSLAQLNRAAYLSRAAAIAPHHEDKKIYADAAFAAATGGLVQFEVPPDIQGVPVMEVDVFEDVKRRYEEARAELQFAEDQLHKVQYASNEAGKLRQIAELKLKREHSSEKDQRALARNDGKAEAEQLLKEAMELEVQVGAKLSQAEQELEKARTRLNGAEQQTRKYIDELGKSGSTQTGR